MTVFSILIAMSALTVTAQNSIKASWNASLDTNATSYSLYSKTAAATNFTTTTLVGILNTNASIPAIPYTLYELYVSARDVNALESDPSNKVRTENVYVNGIGNPTSITLLDVGILNFSGFVLTSAPTNGILTGNPPNVVYTTTGNGNKDVIVYKSPEIFAGSNITNYYSIYKAFINNPPVISVSP